jgi:hypothetical protein
MTRLAPVLLSTGRRGDFVGAAEAADGLVGDGLGTSPMPELAPVTRATGPVKS